MLYILSLLTRFIPTKPMAFTQLPFSMNQWIPFFRTAIDNICLFYKWPYRCLLPCPFCFRRCFKKSGYNPRDKVLHNLQLVNFVMKFSPNQSFRGVCKIVLVWHQPVVDQITIESFENCVYKKPRWRFSSLHFCITLPSHTSTSNLYHALQV